MKEFEPSFFKLDTFILSKKKYGNISESLNEEVIHICYNVNDAFIPVMGASMISVIENNKDILDINGDSKVDLTDAKLALQASLRMDIVKRMNSI